MRPMFLAADWLVFWAYYQKSQEKLAANISILNEELAQEFSDAITSSSNNLTQDGVNDSIVHHDLPWNDNVRLFFELRFANFMDVCIPAFLVSYIFFFAIGGYLHVSKTHRWWQYVLIIKCANVICTEDRHRIT